MQDTVDPAAAPPRTLAQIIEDARRTELNVVSRRRPPHARVPASLPGLLWLLAVARAYPSAGPISLLRVVRGGFFPRLLVPRGVCHAMHPGRAVKGAVTPSAVNRARRAFAPRRRRCVLDAALDSDGYPIRPERQSSRLAAWKLSGQPPEP